MQDLRARQGTLVRGKREKVASGGLGGLGGLGGGLPELEYGS